MKNRIYLTGCLLIVITALFISGSLHEMHPEVALSFSVFAGSLTQRKDLQSYSLLKALSQEKLDGIELEMSQEADHELRSAGKTFKGLTGIGIPRIMLDVLAKRHATAASVYAIPTVVDSFIDALGSKSVLSGLGTTFLSGLKDNVQIPRSTIQPGVSWVGENDALPLVSGSYGGVNLSPKRLGGEARISKILLKQTSLLAERMVFSDILKAIARSVEKAALCGTGLDYQPTGVLSCDIQIVELGTDGALPTYNDLVELESVVAGDDADVGSLAFITNSKVRRYLRRTQKIAGESATIYREEGPNHLLSYNTQVTNNVPSNLTKGTGTGLSAILFGNFADLVVAQWFGIDLQPNPYTYSSKALNSYAINGYFDVAVRHSESFAAIVDAQTD